MPSHDHISIERLHGRIENPSYGIEPPGEKPAAWRIFRRPTIDSSSQWPVFPRKSRFQATARRLRKVGDRLHEIPPAFIRPPP
jgi:hypothetical protein